MLKNKGYNIIWLVSVILSSIIMYLFYNIDGFHVENILQIQFSDNINQFENLIKPNDLKTLKNNTFLDFGYILSYSILFFSSIKLIFRAIDFELIKWVAFLSLVPGALDVIENFALLNLIDNTRQPLLFCLYFWLTRIKWTLVIVFALITLSIFTYYGFIIITRLYDFFFSKKNIRNNN